MSLPFLLEIGTEEIPDWMIPGALENLRSLFASLRRPGIAAMCSWMRTPRRLVLRAAGRARAPGRIPRSELMRAGRSPRRAKAVAGFARKLGVAAEDLAVQSTAKGEYYSFLRKIEGRATIDILAEALPGVILKIYFPKTMYWTGKSGPRFIRPIRWIVALLGSDVVPFEIAGVQLGQRHGGPSPAGCGDIPVTHRKLRAAPARQLRDPLGRRTAPEDRRRNRGAGRHSSSPTRRCSKRWST